MLFIKKKTSAFFLLFLFDSHAIIDPSSFPFHPSPFPTTYPHSLFIYFYRGCLSSNIHWAFIFPLPTRAQLTSLQFYGYIPPGDTYGLHFADPKQIKILHPSSRPVVSSNTKKRVREEFISLLLNAVHGFMK